MTALRKRPSNLPTHKLGRLVPKDLHSLYGFIKIHSDQIARDIASDFQEKQKTEGRLVVVEGPLFSGKTSVILALIQLLPLKEALVIAQPKLNRSDLMNSFVHTWDGEKAKAVSYSRKEIPTLTRNAQILVIDEVMFTPYEDQSLLIKEIELFVDRGGYVVVIGLLYNGFGGKFLIMDLLMRMAHQKYQTYSVCQKCGNSQATIGQRFMDGKPAGSSDSELVPPSDTVWYEPRCKECFVTI